MATAYRVMDDSFVYIDCVITDGSGHTEHGFQPERELRDYLRSFEKKGKSILKIIEKIHAISCTNSSISLCHLRRRTG